ncbi:MAG TPA: hypothetical protein ENK88_04960 [Campylobacterales bacterium]|nr:hypothetical protein [Campylobacterales bacterium]
MKKIYGLIFISIVTLCSQEQDVNLSIEQEQEPTLVGGSCSYRDFIATAKIISTDGQIKYRFNEMSILPRYLNTHTTYTISYRDISKEYTLNNSLTVGSLHTLKISEITSGTCSPSIIEFVNSNSWKKFSKSEYKSSDYSMREDVAYFEFRKYLFDVKTDKQVTKKYIPYLSIYRKKLSSYDSKIISDFQNIPFNPKRLSNFDTINLGTSQYDFKVKGFLIKKDNKFWTINEKRDIVWLFDKIDTEAELYQFLKVYNLMGSSFRKTSDGYDVKQVKIEYKSDKKSKGDFDEYTEYEIDRTYIYHIKSNGEFTKELISMQRKNEKKSLFSAGFHANPEPFVCPPPPIPLKEILKDKKFVTPSS